MGYESKLYVVNKTKVSYDFEKGDDNRRYFALFVAEFDLSKCYGVSSKMRTYPSTNCYFYGDSGEVILKDNYGDALCEIPLEDAIEILNEEITIEANQYGEQNIYRRFIPCKALLEALQKEQYKWDDLVVLHYGY